MTTLFILFPLWWLLGLADLIWIPMAVVMAVYLAARGRVRAPRGFGVWLVFLAFMLASVVQINSATAMIGVAYHALTYLSVTAILLYVHNASEKLRRRNIAAILASFWAGVVAFGYAAVAFPAATLRTPMYWVLAHISPSLLSNSFVRLMVVRHLSSYSPDSYFQTSPRPSAPFLYANNWGNVYSLVLPVVIAYLAETKERGLWWRVLVVLVPLSAVPAFLTLNRGMFLGLGIAAAYSCARLAARGRVKAILGLAGLVVGGAIFWMVLPVAQGLQAKEASTTTRTSLYLQSLDAASRSPILGYGAPISANDPTAPPVGTQGQIWQVLVSNGVIALMCFVGFFVIAAWRTRHIRSYLDLAYHTSLIISVVEIAYYGVTPYGLPVMMAFAGVALSPRTRIGTPRSTQRRRNWVPCESGDPSLIVVEQKVTP